MIFALILLAISAFTCAVAYTELEYETTLKDFTPSRWIESVMYVLIAPLGLAYALCGILTESASKLFTLIGDTVSNTVFYLGELAESAYWAVTGFFSQLGFFVDVDWKDWGLDFGHTNFETFSLTHAFIGPFIFELTFERLYVLPELVEIDPVTLEVVHRPAEVVHL